MIRIAIFLTCMTWPSTPEVGSIAICGGKDRVDPNCFIVASQKFVELSLFMPHTLPSYLLRSYSTRYREEP